MRRGVVVMGILVLAVAAAAVALVSIVGGRDNGQGGAAAAEQQILYSLDARAATVSGTAGARRLALPAASRVVWFTDRPERRSGTTTLAALASIWEASGFVADPPNAAVILSDGGVERTHVVELLRPRKTADSISFAVRPVASARVRGYQHSDPIRDGSYAHATAFIDDAALPPCPGTIYPSSTTTLTCLLGVGGVIYKLWPVTNGSSAWTQNTRTTMSFCSAGVSFELKNPNYKYYTFPLCSDGYSAYADIEVCEKPNQSVYAEDGTAPSMINLYDFDRYPVVQPDQFPKFGGGSPVQVQVTFGRATVCDDDFTDNPNNYFVLYHP